jgi:carbonic anhydrase
MYEVANIFFKENFEFISVKEMQSNQIFVVPKTVCIAFGIDWKNQQEKLSNDYERWEYKTLDAAASQLTKIAKKLWEKENWIATKETIVLASGRSVAAYVFPIKYAEEALEYLVKIGKIKKD